MDFDALFDWMRSRGMYAPRATTCEALLESIVEQATEEGRQSGYDAGYEMAADLYSQDQS